VLLTHVRTLFSAFVPHARAADLRIAGTMNDLAFTVEHVIAGGE
jgi:hypothetical protein